MTASDVFLLALVLGTASGCQDDGPVELFVDLKTDLLVPHEIDRVRVDVDGEERSDAPVDPAADYLAGERIFETTTPRGDVRIDVRLLAGDIVVLARTVRVRVEGPTGVTVLMTRDCRNTICEDPDAPACVAGTCAPETCTVETSATCPPAECASTADCGATPECVTARCEDGACLFAADESACPAEERCVPEVGCAARARGTPPTARVTARISGERDDEALDGVVHPGGGFVATGFAAGAATSFSFEGPFPTEGTDGFVARFADDGSLDWVTLVGGADDGTDVVKASVADAAGNVYVAGSLAGPATFGSMMTEPTSGAAEEAFVASWTADGTFRWVNRFAGRSEGNDLLLHADGSLWVTGSFHESVDLGGPTLSSGDRDVFVAQLDSSSGAATVAVRFGGEGNDVGRALALSPGGDVVLAASFGTAVELGGERTPGGGAGIARISTAGAITAEYVGIGVSVEDVAVTSDDRLVLAARTRGGPASLVGTELGDFATFDAVAASLDAAGELEWVHVFGDAGSDLFEAVAVDDAGSAYLAGSFEVALEPGGGAVYANGRDDMLLVSYDAAGAHRWTRVYGERDGDFARSISLDPASTRIVVGASFGDDGGSGGVGVPLDLDGVSVEGGGRGTGVVFVME